MNCSKSIPLLANKIFWDSSYSLRRRCTRHCVWTPACLSNNHNHCRKLLSARVEVIRKKVDRKKYCNESSNMSSDMFKPLEYEDVALLHRSGEELSGPISKFELQGILNDFRIDPSVRELAIEQGLTENLFNVTIQSFRKYCLDTSPLPTELHLVFYDLKSPCLEESKGRHLHNLFPFFWKHANDIFPHLKCMDDLNKIADLRDPMNWFPEARAMKRKVIFHAGPTNSGKTYHAMEKFLAAKSGRYHGPLKMLAVEVFRKSNALGTPCDLLTGEERLYAISDKLPADHISCTVEMAVVNQKCDVAIIDEIQMIQNIARGWAWTRALLGVPAKELHVCGEGSAIQLVRQLVEEMGDIFEVQQYKRLTKLTIEKQAIGSLDKIRPGDCIVCFNLRDIHTAAKAAEELGHEVSIIYGDLPPGTKNAQSQKFNDPDHKCNVMVATDAIGMGINLSIRRIVFFSLVKPSTNLEGEKEIANISVSQVLQIAGRAGRYGTQYEEGFVTCLKHTDYSLMKRLLSCTPPGIEQAGIRPTVDQIELFAFHLRNYDITQLIDIFLRISTIDSDNYFMCQMNDLILGSKVVKDVPLPLRVKYTFCNSPISYRKSFPRFMMREFALKFSNNSPIDYEFMKMHLKWPFSIPKNHQELIVLEESHEVLTLYFWLSYRFEDMFPHRDLLRDVQEELDNVILEGVSQLIALLSKEAIKTAQLHKKLKQLKAKNEFTNIKITLKQAAKLVESGDRKQKKSIHMKDISKYLDSKNINKKPKKR